MSDQEFLEFTQRYESLARVLKGVIEEFLSKENVAFSMVTYRVKTIESFKEKAKRKNIEDPFSEITDICGLRIVYPHSRDLKKIISILSKEFEVKESDNKEDYLNPDQFGYRSHHIIAKIKSTWASAPQYRNCTDLKFEIQIRSILMHSWADISHSLFYKKDSSEIKIQRRLYRLSALMEMADAEIDAIVLMSDNRKFENPNLNSIQNILDEYLPDRIKSESNILAKVIDEMDEYGLSSNELKDFLENKLNLLENVEQDVFKNKIGIMGVESRWMQVGIIRAVMYISKERYWVEEGKKYDSDFVQTIEAWREKIKLEVA
jgi:putative GTP pyrophosphokinase